MNGEKKKKLLTGRNVIIGILLLCVIVSGIGVLRDQMEAKRQKEKQESLAQLASQTPEVTTAEPEPEPEPETETEEETQAPYVSPVDFEALRAQNPDIVGWIRVPDTKIDYPIVQAQDNEKYLDTGFDGTKSVYGAIYLDCDSNPDFSGWNNPLYGHNMKDGSMFKDVVKFKDQDFFNEHRYFTIYTPEREIRLKTVSCYYSTSDGIVRKTQFKSRESFDAWVNDRLSPCKFAEIPGEQIDSMFVLVTCSYEFNDARTLLFAVEADENGNPVAAGKE